MPDNTTPVNFFDQDYIYLILGVLVIITALIFNKTLGSHPVTLKIDKIGFQLNADRLTLFFLLGFIIIGVGIFFKFRGYENRLSNFEKALNNETSAKATLEDLKNKLGEYEMQIIPEFDPSINAEPKNLTYFIKGKYSGKTGVEIRISPVEILELSGIPKFFLEHIKQGDKFNIIAQNSSNERWMSEEIEIPKTTVKIK
jgi:hypothetical protein